MADIIFVNQFDWEISDEQILPIGLLSLSQVLKKDVIEAQICDFNWLYFQGKIKLNTNFHTNVDRMAHYLVELKPCIISFYTMAHNYHIALSICDMIKKYNSEIYTILAGPQATAVAAETLKCFSQIDLIAMGEGELTICHIVKHLKIHGLDGIGEVDGISCRIGEQIITNWNKFKWIKVDELPILDFTQIDSLRSAKIDVLEMEIGRGCPFNCTYCSTSRFWGRNYRIKGVNRTIQEIQNYIEKYGTKVFLFQHDLFTFDKKYVLELCDRIISENLQIKWVCYARLDVIDEEMIIQMAQTGCIKLFFGLETGSPKIQTAVKKRLDVNKIFSLLDIFAKFNVDITISFIYGFPEEDSEDLNQTLSLMYRIKEQSYLFHSANKWVDVFLSMLMYFADTEITDRYFEQLVFDSTYFEVTKKLVSVPSDILTMIKENKKVFSQYCVMPKMDDKKYRFLAGFINGLFSSFYYLEHELISEAIGIYSGNILSLYFDIYENSLQDVEKIYHFSYNEHNDDEVISTLHNVLSRVVEREQE